MLGIGAVIGAGIFSVGTAAAGGADHLGAGPALILSFVLTAIACGFAALCYAELAAMVPISGSAYTYSYATLGELVAWIIGWDLIIEYAVGNIAVAISWSGYFQELLRGFGIFCAGLARALDYRTAAQWAGAGALEAVAAGQGPARRARQPRSCAGAQRSTTRRVCLGLALVFNLPAFLIVMLHHDGPGARHPGERPFQQLDGGAASSPSSASSSASAASTSSRRTGRRSPPTGSGHRLGGGDHLLRLHRLRRGFDGRRGEPSQPGARHADRDPRQPRRSAR